ncbi:indole-3-glycerol phosphate synthase TrpC [Leptolyngbya cf. ectocarpi LEGE 11479]|uniref:Indole-3-glycerol phosphate synthase n=1 Tax=Leptolyngbya cf. ectocarpi LEGE 11479 TaxID=1828722 RepID=A0A928ZUP4_LEPEC|nr:indole-3-glycerol phosphate synthase TrpC [Leptolyngbya ectocarpi]MBE9067740.1 indole-3-glycerol phosphate synthase TrpC [Leptolyngbya cf. ectocarpi LEGE 11479]
MKIRRRSPNPAVAVDTLRYQVKVPDSEPHNILEKIVWQKETEVARLREKAPLAELQRQVLAAAPPLDFAAALRQGKTTPAVIAEVKKASPSKGVIREDFDPVAIATAYKHGGATCLSVLTDRKFFQGSFEYLAQVRQAVDLPLLCKEFIIYPYQIYQARIHGADAILLIAAILSDKDLGYFTRIAKALGMTALVEVHTAEELDRVLNIEHVKVIGVNNRNLENFLVSLDTTRDLLAQASSHPRSDEILFISESGIHQPSDVAQVTKAGAQAILVGESLMRQPDPGIAIGQLMA